MSPEALAANTRLAVLRQELAADLAALVRHETDIEELDRQWAQSTPDRPALAFSAVALHAWYTGFESMLERIARALDRSVPEGERSHAELLRQMQIEIGGVRPALIPVELAPDLDELRKFRHFFRHAYHVDLNALHLTTHMRTLVRVKPPVHAAFDRFERFLDNALAAIRQP